LSGFDSIAGTRDDCLLFIALVEHWYYVFLGNVPDFTSPNFFAPVRGVLGYSDALFLLSVPYAILRAFGLDRFLSFEFVLIGTRALGFAAMYVFLVWKRPLKPLTDRLARRYGDYEKRKGWPPLMIGMLIGGYSEIFEDR